MRRFVPLFAWTMVSMAAGPSAAAEEPRWVDPPENNFVDRHVFAKLKLLNMPPSDLCTDAEFLRRSFLDLGGTLPTPAEATAFLNDRTGDKRVKLIETLLAKPDFADFWTLQWMEALHARRSTLGLKGAQAFRLWLRGHIEKNTPFDRVVYQLLTAVGSHHENGAAGFYVAMRQPSDLAELTATVFLGVRLQCARCHKHPTARWTQDDHAQFAAFFARVAVRTESGKQPSQLVPEPMIVSVKPEGELTNPRTGKRVDPAFLGAPATIRGDRRAVLAAWITGRDNPFFARAIVNRVWFQLRGRGIVHPVDDFRPTNPPANDELLDALAQDFVVHKFDLKHLIRTIMQSRTYQLSPVPNAFNKHEAKFFSRTYPRFMSDPMFLDAIAQATEVPEKYDGMPLGTRAIQLPGYDPVPDILSISRPARTSDCERDQEPQRNQALMLQLTNGEKIQKRLVSPKGRIARLLADTGDVAIMHEVFLALLSRPPTETEAKTIMDFVKRAPDHRRAWDDVMWSLLNTREFLMRQ